MKMHLIMSSFVLGLTGLLCCGPASSGYPGAPDIHPALTRNVEAALLVQGRAQEASSQENRKKQKNLELLAFVDLGFVSDVWAHKDFAYVGGIGPFPVRIVDISDPTNPQLVAELEAAEPDSSPQDVKVAKINTEHFSGDLLVVGNGGGAPPTFGGIQLFDVSDPANPVLLSEPRIGPVHNTFLYTKGNRAFVLLAIPFAEVFSGPNPFNSQFGDFVIVEVTDPRNPVIVGDWGAGKNGGFPFGFPGFPGECAPCRGDDFAGVFNHDVWANKQGTIAYLSYWDLGLILLDISDPTNPTLLGRGIEPPTFGSDEGNLHNAVPARDGNLVLVADEDFTALPFGFLRIFDTSDRNNPVQIGAFATDKSLTNDGIVPSLPFSLVFSIHNIVVRGSKAYISWYDEGIRVVDFSNPSNPREIASFIAPGAPDVGFFWGVYVHRDLILGSDLFSGLYILKLK